VDVISDAMYSDSRFVVDALAELIEDVVQRHQAPTVSEERMTQVRYIMQVDEASFRSNISPGQLVLIESKEMESILDELISAIGLQRFRFVERQNNGMSFPCMERPGLFFTSVAHPFSSIVTYDGEQVIMMCVEV
jgi:hypothetical protein